MKNNCLANILKVINVLQNNAIDNCQTNNSCTKPFLGEDFAPICFNTRLVTFYRCDNSLVSLPYTIDGEENTTTIFRIQNVGNKSVTVLLVRDNGDGTYSSTNTFATINLDCICAIRCIGDTTIINV
jgi:hypothetical protein